MRRAPPRTRPLWGGRAGVGGAGTGRVAGPPGEAAGQRASSQGTPNPRKPPGGGPRRQQVLERATPPPAGRGRNCRGPQKAATTASTAAPTAAVAMAPKSVGDLPRSRSWRGRGPFRPPGTLVLAAGLAVRPAGRPPCPPAPGRFRGPTSCPAHCGLDPPL